MKIPSKILTSLGLIAVAFSATAQRSIDVFEATRTYPLGPITNIVSTALAITGNWLYLAGSEGAAKIDLWAETNTGVTGGTLTATIQVSTDTTNWLTLTNTAVISAPTVAILTNNYYGVPGILSTNVTMVPGIPTSPVAATAGFATPFIQSFGYTNGGSALTMTAGVPQQIGFIIDNQPRYWRIVWTPGGSVANWTVGANLTTAVRKY